MLKSGQDSNLYESVFLDAKLSFATDRLSHLLASTIPPPDYVRVFPRLSPFANLRINLDLLPKSFSSYLLGPRSWSSPLVVREGFEPSLSPGIHHI